MFTRSSDGFDLVGGGLSAQLSSDGVQLDRTLHVRTLAWGRGEQLAVLDQRELLQDGDRVTMLAPGVREWWRPVASGIEQGWTILAAPAGSGPVGVEVAVSASVRVDGSALALDDLAGADAWSVSELACWDARGVALPCQFSTIEGGFRVFIDDDGAMYPVEIDPIYRAADALIDDDGIVYYDPMVGDGDVNGDGYADVMIAAHQGNASQAWIYLGDPSGEPQLALSVTGLDMELAHDATMAFADVNADGYDDVIGGADLRDSALLFLGPDLQWTARLESDCSSPFGYSVANAGDFNGDGYEDVLVGSLDYMGESMEDPGPGCTALYPGSPDVVTGEPAMLITGVDAWDQDKAVGSEVDGLGDVNGDGFSDIGLNSVLAGGLYWFLGSGSPPSTLTTADAAGVHGSVSFGVAGAGDINADGYADVLGWGSVGAYFFPGSEDGLAVTVDVPPVVDTGYFAFASGAGDVDGDGFDDVLVSSSQPYEAYLFRGSATGLILTPSATLKCGDFGSAVTGAGDVDGDGLDDVLVSGDGSVCLFLGSTLAGPGDTGFTTYVEPDSDSGAPPVSDDGGKSGCAGQGCGGGSISALLLVPGLFGLRRRT